MLYEETLKQQMLDILNLGVSSIADSITALMEVGYIPSRRKRTILDWSIILIHAYENVDILSEEQQKNLDNVYNKVLKL